jgi:hypothetical protein
MDIEIDAAAKKWIKAKGNELTVKRINVQTCCAPGVQELLAIPGKPKQLEQYQQYTVDDVSFYVEKDIRGNHILSVQLSGFACFKTISANLHEKTAPIE